MHNGIVNPVAIVWLYDCIASYTKKLVCSLGVSGDHGK